MNKKMNVAVFGCSGQMGQEIYNVLMEHHLVPYLGIYHSRKPEGYLNTESKNISKYIDHIDLWIDFAVADGFDERMKMLVKSKAPIVSGTTGLTDQQIGKLKALGKKRPVLWSSNMSIGIAVLTEALKAFGKIKNFDFQIEELHHSKKKDSPSGTARTLQEKLESVVNKKLPHPLGIRGGGIFGVHKVWAMSNQEVLMFEHQALNRRVFAEGAVVSGLKLLKMPAGFYQMKDVI